MKRIELLEALYLQGKKMRELQVYYFSLRKGGGRFSSPEAKKVLAQSKLEELQYDKMVTELESPLAPSGGDEGLCGCGNKGANGFSRCTDCLDKASGHSGNGNF